MARQRFHYTYLREEAAGKLPPRKPYYIKPKDWDMLVRHVMKGISFKQLGGESGTNPSIINRRCYKLWEEVKRRMRV